MAFLVAISPLPLSAKVTRVEIISRADVMNGQSFGDAGPYERITGRVYISLAIASDHNRRIVDLANAINLKNGEVEFSADFVAIQPKDPSKGNGSMILESPNRGHSAILRIVDGGDWNAEHDAGDAWLLRKGFSFVSLGWQWDASDGFKLYAPIAKENGKTITGLLRGDLMLSKSDGRNSSWPLHWRKHWRNRISCRESRRSSQCSDGARLARSAAYDNSRAISGNSPTPSTANCSRAIATSI